MLIKGMEFRQSNNSGGIMTGGHHDGGRYDPDGWGPVH